MIQIRGCLVLALSALIACSLSAQQSGPSGGGQPHSGPVLGPMHMKGNVPPGVGGVPPGVPAPTAAEAATIAQVKAFEKACDDAAVNGDAAFLRRALAPTFIMTHGDGWIVGDAPIKVDTKESWITYISKQPGPYIYRRLSDVEVELHGDVAITIGKYEYLPRPSGAPRPASANGPNPNAGTHLYVWFERVYAKRDGQWQFLSHRTVNGPGRALDTASASGN